MDLKDNSLDEFCFNFLDDYHAVGFDSIPDAVICIEEVSGISEDRAWEIFKEWMRMKQLTMVDEIFNNERISYVQ